MIMRLETYCYTGTIFLLSIIAFRLAVPFHGPSSSPLAKSPRNWQTVARADETTTIATRNLFSSPRDETIVTGSTGSRHQSNEKLPRLVGVVITPTERLAILDLGGRIARLRPASTMGAWTVVSIEDRAAVLQSGAGTERIVLEHSESDKTLERGVPRARR